MLGKVADWKIPLGPYTPVQIAVAVGGGFLLVKTISWWSWMGPVPLAGWVLLIWLVRRPKVGGRTPVQAALGWTLLAWQPRGGRIGGRPARDRAAHPLLGGFTIEASPAPAALPTAQAIPAPTVQRRAQRAPHPVPAPGRAPAPGRVRTTTPAAARPASSVQQLLVLARQGGAR
ncbi:hypothetical protein [Streptomyces sp. NPDC000983]|uniref:hypothetical protein n=1 Tax=Streptomyces sp. NPDC000983 TaxID=3154373 RepID=UPI00332183D6